MPLRKTVDLNGGSRERLRGKCRLQRNQPMKPSSRFRELDVDWHDLFEQMMGHGARKRAFEETEVFLGLELAGALVVDPGSGIQTGILDFGHLDLMLLDLLIKRTAGYTQSLGRLFYPPALLLQHSLYVLFFEVQECQA